MGLSLRSLPTIIIVFVFLNHFIYARATGTLLSQNGRGQGRGPCKLTTAQPPFLHF